MPVIDKPAPANQSDKLVQHEHVGDQSQNARAEAQQSLKDRTAPERRSFFQSFNGDTASPHLPDTGIDHTPALPDRLKVGDQDVSIEKSQPDDVYSRIIKDSGARFIGMGELHATKVDREEFIRSIPQLTAAGVTHVAIEGLPADKETADLLAKYQSDRGNPNPDQSEIDKDETALTSRFTAEFGPESKELSRLHLDMIAKAQDAGLKVVGVEPKYINPDALASALRGLSDPEQSAKVIADAKAAGMDLSGVPLGVKEESDPRYAEFYKAFTKAQSDYRNPAMADAVDKILSADPTAKVALFAGADHLSYGTESSQSVSDRLKDQYGSVVIGFSGADYAPLAQEQAAHPEPPPPGMPPREIPPFDLTLAADKSGIGDRFFAARYDRGRPRMFDYAIHVPDEK